ncbi:MAG: AMP-binding protein [Desulfovibrionaceae bacterium]|nr:AMP-binding protein [Desulfovibrionaceae bacterium]
MAEQISGDSVKDASVSSVADERPGWWRHFEDRPLPDVNFRKMPLTDVLDEAARLHGNRVAVRFQNLKWSYARLKDLAEAFAASLRLRGVNPGDRVAIMLPNIPQTVVALWGVLKAGAVVVMTNPLYMEKELTHHFADSRADILITLDLLWPKIEPLWPKLGLRWCAVTRIADGLAFPLNLIQPWKARREGHAPVVPYDGKKILRWKTLLKTRERYAAEIREPEQDLALLQYTGGTTGVSKAAMLSHQNLAAQMQIIQSIIGGDASSKQYTFLSIMPFFHVFGLVGNIILPALYAGTTIPVPRYTPGDLLRTIQKYRPNFFVGAPSVYMSLMQQKDISKYDLTCIELCISGSAPFPKEAMVQFQKMTGAHITEGLGLTEASPCVAANPLYGLQKIGSVGTPLPGTELRIVDTETGTKVLGDNEPGELIVRGPQVMLGYWNRPEETALTLRNGWLYTGDIAYRDEDGYYFIVDRKKDMAIVGGYNVYPHEVDEVLYEHPKVAEAVAVSVPHRTRGETLKAYIVPKKGETLTVPELVAHCRAKLANYKVPKFFEFRTELPKTLVGKVLRRVLREEEEQKLREKAGELMDKAKEQAENLAGIAREHAGTLADKAKVRAGELMDKAREQAGTLADKAKEHAGSLAGKAMERAGDLMDKARDRADELADKAKLRAGELMGKARERLSESKAPSDDSKNGPDDTAPSDSH